MRVSVELFRRLETHLERDIVPRAQAWLHQGGELFTAARKRDAAENFLRGKLWAQRQLISAAAALIALIAWWERLMTRYFALLQLRSGVTAVQRALPF